MLHKMKCTKSLIKKCWTKLSVKMFFLNLKKLLQRLYFILPGLNFNFNTIHINSEIKVYQITYLI